MVNEIKRKGVKDTLLKLGLGAITVLGLSQFVSAGFVQKINGLNYLIEGNTEKNIGSVTRDGNNLVTSVVVAGRTITVNRDVDNIVTGWEDTNFETILTRDVDNFVTDWVVNKL